jgi:hypothetical protein
MNRRDRNLFRRALDDSLSQADSERLRRLLEISPDLQREMNQRIRLRETMGRVVRASAVDAAPPFFADRVMRRLTPARSLEEDYANALSWLFRRVAVACVLIVTGIAAYNVANSARYTPDQSTIEAVLALPPVTLYAAYDLDLPTDP